MQDILHTAIIALQVGFATLMILDLISTLKQLWDSCKPSTSVSIPAPILQPLLEVVAPAAEPEALEIMPDPWTLEAFVEPIISNPDDCTWYNGLLRFSYGVYAKTHFPRASPKY